MHIILSVLNIIRIVLLLLLAVLLFFLLVVLFVPIAYNAKGHYDKNTTSARVQLLFLYPFLQVLFSYTDGIKEAKLKLFGICIKNFFKKKEKKKNNGRSSKNTEAAQTVVDEQLPRQRRQSAKHTPENDGHTPTQSRSLWRKIRFFFCYIKEKLYSTAEKCLHLRDTLKAVTDHINHYREIWSMDVTQEAFAKAKKTLLRLVRGIKPRKGLLKLRLGTDDPAKTGELCAFFGMIYPFIGNYVMIEPDFEQEIFEGDFYVKGHFNIFMLLRAAWIFLFDKDIKKLKEILMNSD